MNYQEAIRIAEEREAKLKNSFDRFDCDGSGTIDMEEVLPLLDDLGMIKKLRSDRVEFCSKKFVEVDTNSDGTLTFEEFKSFYNAAIDDAAGKKSKPKSKKMKADSPEEQAKIKAMEEECRKRAEVSEQIRKENEDAKKKAASAGKGKSATELDSEIQNDRLARMKARQEKKKAEQERIRAENRARKQKMKNIKAKVDDDVLDDEIDVDGDGIADMTAAEKRKQQAAEGKQKLADREADYKQREKDLEEMKKNTKAKVDDDLLDDMIDVDGDGVADKTAAEVRKEQAAAGKQKVADREADYKQREKDLEEMKKNTKAKVDDDLLDDGVDTDGDGKADTTQAEVRAELGMQ